MAATERQNRPSGSRRHSFMRMLDLEKKHKVDRLQSSSAVPVQPARRPSTSSNDLHRRPSTVYTEHPSRPLKANGRTMSVPVLPSFPDPPTQSQLSIKTQSAEPRPLRINIPQTQEEEDEGNRSDASSICRSPGWDNSKTKRERKDAKEAREKRRKEKAKAEKDAKDFKKHSKKLSKAPPTNKVFEKMLADPIERSTSAPSLEVISESRSRRSSIEAGLKGLNPWKHDKPPTLTEPEPALGGGGFVGGLKLTQQTQGAMQNQTDKQTANTDDTSNQGRRGASGPPVQRVPQYLKFQPTMPPAEQDSGWDDDFQSRNGYYNGSDQSYNSRTARDQDSRSGASSPVSIMERKIKRRPKTKISSQDQERLDARNGYPPLPTADGLLQPSRPATASTLRRPRLDRIATEPVSMADDLAEMPVTPNYMLRGFSAQDPVQRITDQFSGAQDPVQRIKDQYSGRPKTGMLPHEYLASTTTPSPDVRQKSSSRQDSSSSRSRNLEYESDGEISPTTTPESYHAFVTRSQIPPLNQEHGVNSAKTTPAAPSFKNFKTAAKAAFSRTPQLPLDSASSSNSSNTTVGAISKAERVFGESTPTVPPLPPTAPGMTLKTESRTSHSSSLRSSSEENSLYDESSATNITTPSASRPQSQKDEYYAARDYKSAAAASILSERNIYDGGDYGENSMHQSWSRTEMLLKQYEDDEALRGSANSRSTPELLKTVAAGPMKFTKSNGPPEKSLGSEIQRHPSLSRSYSNPEMKEDLSFLPPLKHQSLARPFKGKGKEDAAKMTRQTSEPVQRQREYRSIPGPQNPHVNEVSTSVSNPAGGQYLQNARKHIPVTGPLSKPGRLSGQQALGTSTIPGAEPIAKMFVVCCSCHYFHDMPSKIYECMAKPYNIVEDKDLGVSGKMTTAILCPWCSHNMTTQCCAGYAAVVLMREKLH